ncbi:MAG: beta-ketoacyl synthase, partial [Paludibacteraceae bacterium]|nr:beta-ketoacyl synthase [Paludibacteraceae bacterium]
MREIVKIADNIVSPLGMGTEVNYRAVKAGGSALKVYPAMFDMAGPFCAAVFEPLTIEGGVEGDFSRFEKL